MSKEKAKQEKRSRNWVFIAYPDSAPDNWRDILDGEHVEWVESPLHDKDVDPDGEAGECKKPHWHIMLLFPGMKSSEQVIGVTSKINAALPIMCNSAKGTARYMAHMDNPEKFQYDPKEIKGHGGVDLIDLLKPTKSERYVLIREMSTFVMEQCITEFCDLFSYAMNNRFDDWFRELCDSGAYIMTQFIKSSRFKLESQKRAEEEKKYKNTPVRPIEAVERNTIEAFEKDTEDWYSALFK